MSDWEDTFVNNQNLCVNVINTQALDQSVLKKEVFESDLIVGLHSFLRTPDACVAARSASGVLNLRRGIFLTLVGDELNLHNAPMREKLDSLAAVKPDYIGTQLPIDAGKWLYEDIKAEVIPLPHGLNTRYWLTGAIPNRTFHLSGLSVRYPIYLGDNDRNRLYENFIELQQSDPRKYKFHISQDSERRLGRDEWKALLSDSYGTISCEAGTNYLEKDDQIVNLVIDFLSEKAQSNGVTVVTNSKLLRLFHKLPSTLRVLIKNILTSNTVSRHTGIDSLVFNSNLEDEVFDRFFANYKRLPFETKALSSRHLEAVGTQTCQLMFYGNYNGVLSQDKHYIGIAKDFSNIKDALDRLYDPGYRASITEAALSHVLQNHTLDHRLATILSLCS